MIAKAFLFALLTMSLTGVARADDLSQVMQIYGSQLSPTEKAQMASLFQNAMQEAGDSGRLSQLQANSTLVFANPHELKPDSTESIFQNDRLVTSADQLDQNEMWAIVRLKAKSAKTHPTLSAGRVELTPQPQISPDSLVLKANASSPIDSIEVHAKDHDLPNHLLTVAALYGTLYRGPLPASPGITAMAIEDGAAAKTVASTTAAAGISIAEKPSPAPSARAVQ